MDTTDDGAGPGTGSGTARRPRRWVTLPLGVLALVLLVPLTIFFVATWLSGSRLQVVQTGSMEPTYPRGSLLVVEPVDPSDVRPGQALMFEAEWRGGDMVTHRVLRSDTTDVGLTFTTQGDANVDADPFPVEARSVRGVVQWHVAGLGTLLWELRWPRNVLVLVVAPLAALAVSEIVVRRRGEQGPVTTG